MNKNIRVVLLAELRLAQMDSDLLASRRISRKCILRYSLGVTGQANRLYVQIPLLKRRNFWVGIRFYSTIIGSVLFTTGKLMAIR